MKLLYTNCCNSTWHSEWSGYEHDLPPDDGSTAWYVCNSCNKACDLVELRRCPSCSGSFVPHNRLQKYCDSNCRNKANYKKHKRISRAELIEWVEQRMRGIIYNSESRNLVRMFADELLEFINQQQGEEK